MTRPATPSHAHWIVLAAAAAVAAAICVGTRPLAPPRSPAAPRQEQAVAVLPPAESAERFQTQPGFRVDLVAAEPMIEAPVAAAFDEFGRLWVAEMRTYMPDVEGTGELEPRNRILVLEDTDGDGAMDKSTVFADDLVLPRGVAPCHGGALVIEPPHLLFLKDTDGDGRADQRTRLLAGFGGRDNPEHAGNGLLYGLDNGWELSQHSVRVMFDGTTVRTQNTPTVGQWGLTRDDQGRLYYTPNSNPLLVDLFPKHYAARKGSRVAAAGIAEDIARDGTTWPAIPTPTVNRGYREGTLRPDGTLRSVTSACGPAMFRSGAFGDEFRGDVFICEPAGQLVKRLKLETRGDTFNAVNVYRNTEFLRSTDERFRPVNALVGPDGNLYVLDMYRGLIQHRMFLTPHLKEMTRARGMESPVNCGRIWRVVRDGGRATPAPGRLPGACTDAELVDMLRDDRGWWRDTAQRLLVERRSAATGELVRAAWLRRGIDTGEPAAATPAELWTLHGTGLLVAADVRSLWPTAGPELRATLLQLAERLDTSLVLELLRDGAKDDAPALQSALSIGELEGPDQVQLAAEWFRDHPGDRLVRSALLTSITGRETEVLEHLLNDPAWPSGGDSLQVMRELADAVLGSTPKDRVRLAQVVGTLALAGDGRAEALLDRFRSRLRLDSQETSALELSAEPTQWVRAAEQDVPGATLMRRCLDLFKWPGHEVVAPRRIVRNLTPPEWDLYLKGRQVFATVCASCHQAEGQGSPGLAPTLVGSSIANGPGGRMVRVLLQGLEGGYMPGGGSWGVMPPPAVHEASELAAVMTYVRRSWGNTGDPVTPALVARVRQQTRDRTTPWTRGELNGVRE